MDNLSHSLAGFAAGELLHRALPPEADPRMHARRRALLLITCWLGSNFPDLDLVLSSLLPDPLGYLLHHRGHTHTVLYAIPQAAFLCALLWLCWPGARQLLRASGLARIGFTLAAGLGLMLHLAMDWLNPYGVHPFHPFDSRWFYGDRIFILEPVFWIGFGVPVMMLIRRRWLAYLLTAILVAIPAYFSAKAYLSLISLLALCALAGISCYVAERRQLYTQLQDKRGLLLAFGLTIGFVLLQGWAAQSARDVISARLQSDDANARVLDISLNAFPSNPACWTFTSMQIDERANIYRIRRGQLSILPKAIPLRACPAALLSVAGNAATKNELGFIGDESGNLTQLRDLNKENCHLHAWLRFARMPLLQESTATDMRFATSLRGNFTTIDLRNFAGRPCDTVPQWAFPRADLLGQP